MGIFGKFHEKLSGFFTKSLNFGWLHQNSVQKPRRGLNNLTARNKAGAAGIAAAGSVSGRLKHGSAGNALANADSDG